LVALPLAMAFAIASGVSPQAGIYCAVVTGFLISALGGSVGPCYCAARPQPEALMREAGFDRHVGSQNICENISEALKRADELYNTRISTPAAGVDS
jgi:hypothetical protein